MKTFTVVAQVTISLSTNVQAASEREAIMAASERSMPSLCYRCGGNPDTEWATSGELDGTPEELRVEGLE